MDSYWKHGPRKNEENDMDPDDAASTLCFACELPIFSTPIKSFPTNTPLPFKFTYYGPRPTTIILHDECAKLPQELHGHALHPHQPLILRNYSSIFYQAHCSKCREACGRIFYKCPDSECKFELDLVCAGLIRILHRIHEHRLMPIQTAPMSGTPSVGCDACGFHHQNAWGINHLCYLCTLCGFSLHPECASLPNAIVLPHENHQHALRLSYHLASNYNLRPHYYKCEICGVDVTSSGVYFCGKCRYYVHIKCVTSDPQRFTQDRPPKSNCSVLVRDAKFADVLHFPIEDEHTSVVRYILGNTTSSDHEADTGDQNEGKFSPEEIHEHALIFHDQDHELSSRVCNACARFISPPFYSCSICPNFFLHDCCARLPREVKHSNHEEHGALRLFPTASESDIPAIFLCEGCRQYRNGFPYSCETCDFNMDVICALMPPTITHDHHGKSHILYMASDSYVSDSRSLNCCDNTFEINYECSSTCNFRLHANCAALPRTIRHKHDEHPLKLTLTTTILATTGDDKERLFCETCEYHMYDKWCYSCNECDQLFHSECVPSVNPFVRNGATIRVSCHACPLALVRNYEHHYKCSYCSDDIYYLRENDQWVYECSDQCYFRIHKECAKKCLLESE